jgi:hypothetical protein
MISSFTRQVSSDLIDLFQQFFDLLERRGNIVALEKLGKGSVQLFRIRVPERRRPASDLAVQFVDPLTDAVDPDTHADNAKLEFDAFRKDRGAPLELFRTFVEVDQDLIEQRHGTFLRSWFEALSSFGQVVRLYDITVNPTKRASLPATVAGLSLLYQLSP